MSKLADILASADLANKISTFVILVNVAFLAETSKKIYLFEM